MVQTSWACCPAIILLKAQVHEQWCILEFLPSFVSGRFDCTKHSIASVCFKTLVAYVP